MTTSSRALLLGVVFHAFYLYSIFDIYFQSPVVHVAQTHSPLDTSHESPPADRVVLIVGDGLRADKLFQLYADPPFLPPHDLPKGIVSIPASHLPANTTTPAPYLRALITQGRAAWGISHTRVPTESRPGHVALLAGMYEDVSAVTRGWKINPVAFDSILNQSTHAWGFGSPDIVPMFVQGATHGKAEMWCYSAADEDFTADATTLDIWVLDRVEELFANASRSRSLDTKMRQSGNVFFLHLLGLDTTGHSYRPHSPEYHRNIVVVDAIVKRIERLFDTFFEHDGRTSYVFTADHGMTNIGNHGDGNPDATRTPLVVWGSGVQPAGSASGDHDTYSLEWKLDTKERIDVEQADIAALMSALIGRPFPANSEGRLPLRYMQASQSYQAHAALANVRGILEQYEVKHRDLAERKLAFRPFAGLSSGPGMDVSGVGHVSRIRALMDDSRFVDAMAASQDLLHAALRGLRYVRTYDRLFLRTAVVAGYLGWMTYAGSFVIRRFVQPAPRVKPSVGLVFAFFGVILASIWARLALEGSPLTYYIYVTFAGFFWAHIFADPVPLATLAKGATRNLGRTVAVLGWLELAVLGYFHRAAWTIGFVVLGVIWPFMATNAEFRASRDNSKLAAAWSVSCMATSIFTLLPVEKGENLTVISGGAVVFIILGAIAVIQSSKPSPPLPPWRQPNKAQRTAMALEEHEKQILARILVFETCLASVSLAVSLTSALSLRAKRGLPLQSQILGWSVLVISSLTPFVGMRYLSKMMHRLLVLIGGFVPTFILLSISYEVFFYLSLSVTLLLWLGFEQRLAEYARRTSADKTSNAASATQLHGRHIRLAICFLHFIHVGFFGTGNVASISSFYLEPVYRLVPVFDPFLMATLLIYKILIPFMVVSAVFSAIHTAVGVPAFSIFLIALGLTDILTLNFFFLVRDQGSWLEIGQSISHFSIASLLIVFMLLLHIIGERMMRPG